MWKIANLVHLFGSNLRAMTFDIRQIFAYDRMDYSFATRSAESLLVFTMQVRANVFLEREAGIQGASSVLLREFLVI